MSGVDLHCVKTTDLRTFCCFAVFFYNVEDLIFFQRSWDFATCLGRHIRCGYRLHSDTGRHCGSTCMIDLDRNTGSMFVYAFTQFEKSWNIIVKVDAKLCCSVGTLRGIHACVLNDQKTCTTLGSLLIIVNMKETHFTILFTVVGSHRCHDDSVFYGHSADGHWFKNMWIFGFHRKIISLFEILSEESITWADVNFLTNER